MVLHPLSVQRAAAQDGHTSGLEMGFELRVKLTLGIGYGEKHTGNGGGCERFIQALDEAQFFEGVLQHAAQVLAKVGAGHRDTAFSAAHGFEIGADRLVQIALRPSFEVASTSQPLIGDILFAEHDRLPPGQFLTQVTSRFQPG
jgi:hypothetical protein